MGTLGGDTPKCDPKQSAVVAAIDDTIKQINETTGQATDMAALVNHVADGLHGDMGGPATANQPDPPSQNGGVGRLSDAINRLQGAMTHLVAQINRL